MLKELGFTEEEQRLYSTPMAKLTPEERKKAVEVAQRVLVAKQEREKATYVRKPRLRVHYGISDHAVEGGDNIWHPNANTHIGSKSQFRAETKARGGVEVGNELEGIAMSDDYQLDVNMQDKQIIINQIDKVMAQVERGDIHLAAGIHE